MSEAKLNSNDLLAASVRLCCGKRHLGSVCPDGKVMCCLCFERFDQDQLNVAANGQKEDVCKKCDELEKAANVQSAGTDASEKNL